MTRIYVATTLTNAPQAAMVAEQFKQAGHSITFPWFEHLASSPDAITADYLEAMSDAEEGGVRAADVLVALMPGGRGTLAEIHLAKAWKIPVIVHCENGTTWVAGPSSCAFLFSRRGIRRSKGALSNAVNMAALVHLVEIAREEGPCIPQYGHAAGVLAALRKVAS